MSYERLTANTEKGLKLRKGKKYVELLADKELTQKALYRLAELEDKIENGLLVEKYFISEEMLHDGSETFNIAEYDPCAYVFVSRHSTQAEAEEKLRELRGEKE